VFLSLSCALAASVHDSSGIMRTNPVRPELFALAYRLSHYGPWLYIALALRDVRMSRWRACGGGPRYVGWLLAQRERIRRAGWFN